MAVTLTREYKGMLSGATVKLPTSEETALVGLGRATAAGATPLTTGAQIQNTQQGSVAFAAAATSVVVTCNQVDANSKVVAYINQATADTTMTSISRIQTAAGSFTLFANAAATAAVVVDWAILPTSQMPQS